jgi:hypothetical protein
MGWKPGRLQLPLLLPFSPPFSVLSLADFELLWGSEWRER